MKYIVIMVLMFATANTSALAQVNITAEKDHYELIHHHRIVEIPKPFIGSLLNQHDRNQLLCLSSAIFYEADHRSVADEKMVAHIVMNRLATIHGNTPCDVVFEKRGGFNFAYSSRHSRVPYCIQWIRVQAIALSAYYWSDIDDNTQGKQFFNEAKSGIPNWARKAHHVGHIVGPHVVY